MDLDYIENLAELIGRTRATEVSVRRGERSVVVRRAAGAPQVYVGSEAPAAPDLSTAIRPAPDSTLVRLASRGEALLPSATETALVPLSLAAASERAHELVLAHRVGIFHRGSSAETEPLVTIGGPAIAGQQLGSIESMRLYDEIESTVTGRVVGICVGDGEPVEYGQPLFHLETGGLVPAGDESSSPVNGAEVAP